MILLILLFAELSFAQSVEPEQLKALRHGTRVQGCVAGLMYYTRDIKVSKAMLDFCERVIKDANFLYDFTQPQNITPVQDKKFKRFLKGLSI